MTDPRDGFSEVVARARRGDRAALTELVRTYEQEIRVMARVLLGPALRPHLDSMDLVQSVHRTLMVGLLEQKFDIATPDNLIALALTIVRRKAARCWRRAQRQERLQTSTNESGTLVDVLVSLSSGEADPGRAAQLREAVDQVCAGLTDQERKVIELRLQGYRTVEVAGELGLDPDVLRVQLSRLRQRLRARGVLDEWL